MWSLRLALVACFVCSRDNPHFRRRANGAHGENVQTISKNIGWEETASYSLGDSGDQKCVRLG
jgi:hypothetical protein